MLRWLSGRHGPHSGANWIVACAVAFVTGAAGLMIGPAPAEAQFWEDIFRANRAKRAAAAPPPRIVDRYYRSRRPAVDRRVERRDGPRPATTATLADTAVRSNPAELASPPLTSHARPAGQSGAEQAAARPLLAVVSLEDQRISLYGADGLIERSKISSGTLNNPTPTGIFGVSQKSRWHESNIYSGAAMPFMQRLTWSGIALHEGRLPGYPASHGCIRLPRAFAERLFRQTRSGFRVVLAPDDIAPVEVSHALLPKGRYRPHPTMVAMREPVRTAGLGPPNEAATLASGALDETTRLDPIAYAIHERSTARAELRGAERGAREAGEAAESASKRARAAQSALSFAERRLAAAYREVEGLGLAGPLQQAATFDPRFPASLVEFSNASAEVDRAREVAAGAGSEAAVATAAEKAAEQRVASLRTTINEMTRRQETASILISRKTERLYIRQGLKPVLELPVTFKDRDEPVGNHAYVALAPAQPGADLRWIGVSLPVEHRPASRKRREGEAVARAVPLETAASALDRIELSGEAIDRIGELVWTGSSIIISDHGPGHDGANGHDFAIETRH